MAISSPCVRNCCLDEKDICLGCGRSIEEIIRWGDADDKEKLQILMASKKRMVNRSKKFAAKNAKNKNKSV